MGIEDFWGNRTGNRQAGRVLQTRDCALRTSGGIGQGLDLLKGHSLQGNVHCRYLEV